MKEILIGTEGDQPFKITAAGVSHKHAKVTIDDENIWRLEDLNSSNGTYVRGSDGTMQRVGKVEIDEMTFIRLGPSNVNGCCFYARQLLSPQSYKKEFLYLNKMEDEFEAMEAKTDRTARHMKFIGPVCSLLILVISLLVNNNKIQFAVLRIGVFVPGIAPLIYDASSRKKKIAKTRERFYQCPNPGCFHVLTAKEVRSMQCPKCKAH